jgi:hypothetical protein
MNRDDEVEAGCANAGHQVDILQDAGLYGVAHLLISCRLSEITGHSRVTVGLYRNRSTSTSFIKTGRIRGAVRIEP